MFEDLHYILNHAEPLWGSMRNARIFITGGTGFMGKWLVKTLLLANKTYKLNLSLCLLTRQHWASDLYSFDELTFHQGDVRTFDYPEGEFSHIVHGAVDACAQLNEHDPQTMYDTIVIGTKQV